ncbi:hypothetical protein STXM2123_753 [Streptomyces sp. F-3]|nr:hypothetical protein STXM2123_753 [Streptomyces sp. F-3]
MSEFRYGLNGATALSPHGPGRPRVVIGFAAPHAQGPVGPCEQRGPLQVLTAVIGGDELSGPQASRTHRCAVGR